MKNNKSPEKAGNRTNYDKRMKEEIARFGQDRPTLLLHSCCGPCSTACLERLVPFFHVTVFFFNPNITESEEYELRLGEQKRYLREVYGEEIPLVEGRYRSREFFELAEGFQKEREGGARCERCFRYRLKETESVASARGFDYFTTTLTVSPHKNYTLIAGIGREYGEKYGVEFLDMDFKKKAGFQRSIELSKEHELYRQNYCGCVYSKY